MGQEAGAIENGRFFGGATTKDIAKLREQMVGVGEV